MSLASPCGEINRTLLYTPQDRSKKKVGSPTKYTHELLEMAEDYIRNPSINNDAVPTIAGLAVYLNVSQTTLHRWAKDESKVDFIDLVAKLLQNQERLALNGGLKGLYNASIAKLLLAKHGYVDKQEITGANGGPIEHSWTVEVVDAPKHVTDHLAKPQNKVLEHADSANTEKT